MDIKEKKAIAYDLISQINYFEQQKQILQQKLQEVNREIGELMKQEISKDVKK